MRNRTYLDDVYVGVRIRDVLRDRLRRELAVHPILGSLQIATIHQVIEQFWRRTIGQPVQGDGGDLGVRRERQHFNQVKCIATRSGDEPVEIRHTGVGHQSEAIGQVGAG
jgi:hypothetical protein